MRVSTAYRFRLVAAFALALLLACAATCRPAGAAQAAQSGGPLNVTCACGDAVWDEAAGVELAAFGFAPIDVKTDPDSISVGVSCGMEEMCGLDPCLCGSADEYGCCACNGLEQRVPDVSMRSSNALAALPVHIGGSWTVLCLLPGEADVVVGGTLLHYDDSVRAYHVESAVTSASNVVVAVAVPVVVALIAFAVRRGKRHADAVADGAGGAGVDAADADAGEEGPR